MIPTEYLLCLLAETVCFVEMFKGCSTLNTVNSDTVSGLWPIIRINHSTKRAHASPEVLQAELFAILLRFSNVLNSRVYTRENKCYLLYGLSG